MRFFLWLTAASFLLYNSVIVVHGIRSSFPSALSYSAGLLASLAPFFLLVVAAVVGLPRHVAHALAILGGLVLVLIAGLIASDQAQFVVPATLILFNVFCGTVLC